MADAPTTSIGRYFTDLPDPRKDRTRLHSLHDILVIALCAVIGGAETWVEVQEFGRAKEAFFRTFLRLGNGVPSHDTFGRVFAALSPAAFERCFVAWAQSLCDGLAGEVIAIDGKTLRRSLDRASGKSPLHMVSAWAAQHRLVLGQVATEDKSNEITAIPKLLEMLDVRDAVVTVDAMGCQKDIAGQIVKGGGDYVMSLKGNHETLHDQVAVLFQEAEAEGFEGMPHDTHTGVDGGHGRVEVRQVACTEEIGWLKDKGAWAGFKSVARVRSQRTVGDRATTEDRYYISSLDGKDARRLGQVIRHHWGVENGLHWALDVSFREDDCRVRTGHAAQNFSILRRIALNLLKRERTSKVGIKIKRHKAGWDEKYLLRVLSTPI